MQVQNRLKRCHWGKFYSFRQLGFLFAIVLSFSLCAPYGVIAQDPTEDEVAAQRKKAEELLDTASAQLDRQQYQACGRTLERCEAYKDNCSSSQRKRFAKYSEEAQAGAASQRNAEAAIQAGTQHLYENQLGPAQEQFKIAYSLKKYLPTPQRKKIEDQLKVIQAKQKIQKKDFITLFKDSKSLYKAGQLDEAEEGFTKVQLSGIKLGFFDTGDLTSTAGYLKKIASKREKQEKEERKRQQELIEKLDEEMIPAVVEPTPVVEEPAPEVVEPTPVVEEPAPKMVEPTPVVEEPAPKMVEPTPVAEEPAPKMVEPTPVAEEPAPKMVEPTPVAEEPAPEVVVPTPVVEEPAPKVLEPTEQKKATVEDELSQVAAPAPITTVPAKQTIKKAPVEQTPVVVETKQKKGAFEFLKKKKAKKSPEVLKAINRKMALADQAISRDNYGQAKQLFLQVLTLDPEHQQAREGLVTARYISERLQEAPRKVESTILERLIEKEDRQKQFVEASFIEAQQEVFQLMEKSLFDDARAQVTSVLAKIEGHKQLLGPANYLRMRGEANAWLDRIENKQQEFEKQDLLRKQKEAQKKREEKQNRIEAARINKIEELYARALSYQEAQEYEQAIATLENLLELDPKNERARIILKSLEDMLLILRQAEYRSKIEIERQKNLTDLDKSSIPYRDKITYPGQEEDFEDEVDWLDLTRRRKQTLAGITPADQAIHDKLSSQRMSPDYQETEFGQVLSDLQNEYKLNLIPLWGSLETTAGISRDDTITMQLDNVPLEKVLDSILEYVSSGKYAKAAYTIDMGTITIAAEDDLPERYYIREYYVADLVGQQAMGMGGMGMGGMMGGRGGMMGGGMMGGGMMGGGMMGGRGGMGRSGGFNRRGGGSGIRGGGFGMGYESNQGRYEGDNSSSDLSLTMYGGGSRRGGYGGSRGGMMGGGMMGGRGGMMGGGMMGGGMGRGMGMGMGMGGSRIYELIYLIRQAVGFDQWEGEDELEQAKGTIDIHGYNVILVKQTWKSHRIIEQLLTRLRKTLGEQVALEIRLLEINSNFLEDIGLDIDFFLNLGNAGYDNSGEYDTLTGRQILIPRSNPGPWNRTTPVPIVQRSYDMAVPPATSIPGSLGGGLNNALLLSGSFLDNVQVDFLMRATQAHQRSRFLDAPHVTVFNGEQASVQFSVTQPYVAELEAVVANRIGIYEPDVQEADTGVSFFITPTITADKRYVILNVYFSLENVLRFETFTFNIGGDTTSTDTTNGGEDGAEGSEGLVISGGSSSTGTIQEPVTEQNTITTRVMVPDGGTLMLGGRKRSTEVEKEVGVPALSKLPLINRLFTNRSVVSDSAVLLILVKPKIILPKEEEELRFGKFETDETAGMFR